MLRACCSVTLSCLFAVLESADGPRLFPSAPLDSYRCTQYNGKRCGCDDQTQRPLHCTLRTPEPHHIGASQRCTLYAERRVRRPVSSGCRAFCLLKRYHLITKHQLNASGLLHSESKACMSRSKSRVLATKGVVRDSAHAASRSAHAARWVT